VRFLPVACQGLVRRAGQDVLRTGWDKFARVHNLEDDFLLTFLYEGDDEMVVKVFDKISCCRHYHTDESSEDTGS
jgi:hypothetical protein